MTNGNALVSGHKGLRGQVLVEIKKAQPVTAKALAETFGVSANAVRRHLKELEAEGLVHYGREHQEVGAPTFAYSLTEQGEALFPNGYRDTLTSMLDVVAESGGREAVVAMFEARYDQLARRIEAETAAVAPGRRLEVLARVLTEAGYMAEWSESDGTFRFAEHNCAMRALVERWPEICTVEERFLERVLGADVRRDAHIGSGCNSCEYAINFSAAGDCGPERVEV